jgi:hypothetical protein
VTLVSHSHRSRSSDLNALKATARGTVTFMKAALRQNLSPAHVKEDLLAFGVTFECLRASSPPLIAAVL